LGREKKEARKLVINKIRRYQLLDPAAAYDCGGRRRLTNVPSLLNCLSEK
jgi:hypothetical protein